MAHSDDVLLDLSDWPGAARSSRPSAPSGVTLPPRPAPRGRRPVPVRALAVGAAVVGLGLLVLPLPGSGCGAPLAVWADAPVTPPAGTGPDLDDAQVAADSEAVRRAQLALAASAPSAAPVAVVPVATTVVRPGSSAAAAKVPQLEQAVADDERDVAVAKAARDDVVEQQQASDDPNAYDAEVAAAQEDLDAAESRLAGDRTSLAQARRAARSTTVTVTSPSPVAVPAAGPARSELAAALAAARTTQAQHLAARRDALTAWTKDHAAQVQRVETANAALRACEGRVRVPGLLGALALLGAGGGLVRQRLTR